MANLTPDSPATFDNVYQLEITDAILGGAGQIANLQAQQLLNRTAYLLNLIQTQYAPLASPTFTGTPHAPTPLTTDNSTQVATTAMVQAAIAALVASAPATLDTLNELATAIGDDPNFATTMTNALAGKAALTTYSGVATVSVAGGVDVTLSGAQAANAVIILTGALTANINVIFPTTGQWIIVNNTTGGYSITAKTALGTGALATNGQPMFFYGDGTNLNVAGSANQSSMTTTSFTATGGQTTFVVNYTPGNLIVTRNGSVLAPSNYTATSGTQVVLGSGATAGDVIEVIAFASFTVVNALVKSNNLSDVLNALTALQNLGADARYSSNTFNISGSATGGVLSLVLAAPCIINTQSSGGAGGSITQHSIAANLSLSIPALASLGSPTGVRSRFYVAYSAQNNCLMVGNAAGVANPETTVTTPTAISGTATSPTTWYTAAGTTATDSKILGYFDATWTSGSGWTIGSTVWAAPGSSMSAQLGARNCNGGMYNSAAQTFSSGSYAKVNLDTNTAGVSSAVVDTVNHQMLVQEDGQYIVSASGSFTPTSGAVGYMQPFRNGTGLGIVGIISGSATNGCAVSGVFPLLANDVIDLRVQNAVNNVASLANCTQLSLVRVGK